ncbi:hypothetical protein PZ938_16785 [Luteipulveratus sp. YIM 133132]|uniref:hypothetical protein n=1 Tax=Luteipulveratus flavus TaxID=3031728 RepID=UPI0023AFF7B3|nr:hypothetical protein [Luteipulveratus sp. YIM 133132]MDE9367278.1 hypothetical protein [Luteipulveratus sp. YIM 133132]
MREPQRFAATVDGRSYEVVASGGNAWRGVGTLALLVDGEESAQAQRGRTVLRPQAEDLGVVTVEVSPFGRAERATLEVDGLEVDLEPEHGSASARREALARRHPRTSAARQGLLAGGAVCLLLFSSQFAALITGTLWFVAGHGDRPHVPSVHAALVPVPALVAVLVAVHETRRRRRQDDVRERLREADGNGRGTDAPAATG